MGNRLADLIRAEIEQLHHIPFARFMELALYHPELGYYRGNAGRIFGPEGDFYTANQLQPVFGELIAGFASQLQRASDSNAAFHVLELGSGRQDLQSALRPWNYRAFDWNTPPLPERMSGMVIANEFFDALPVHLLHRGTSEWRELVVTFEHGEFALCDTADLSPSLASYARHYGSSIPEGGLLEASLSTADWIHRIASLLTSGNFLVIDYGYDTRELIRFPQGTLLGYRRHQTLTDLLANPGTHDITAHVNFTYLREQAIHAGWEIVSDLPLKDWVLGVWSEQDLQTRWNQADARWRLQWKQLVFGMGDTFRVLHLRKT